MWIEALPPFLIIAGSLTFTAVAFKFIDRLSNDGKVNTSNEWLILSIHPSITVPQPKRYGLQEWDKAMIARDKRITGKANKQQVNDQ